MPLEYDETECPYCGNICIANFVDIGVGMQQCGPYGCDNCGAVQIGPHDDRASLEEEEIRTGWHKPERDI